MAEFEIENYTVRIIQQGLEPTYLVLMLSSVAEFHGIISRASIYFFEGTPDNIGSVSNVDQPNFNGHSIYARSNKDNFEYFYRIVQTEKPVSFSYIYDPYDFDPSTPTRKLRSYLFGTGPEPPGEGLADLAT